MSRPPLPVGQDEPYVEQMARAARDHADEHELGRLLAERAAALGFLDRAVSALATSRGITLQCARLSLGLDPDTGRPPK